VTRYWTQFARTGTPNAAGSPHWSTTDGSTVQSLAPGRNGVRPVNFATDHQYAFWQALYR